MELVIDRLTKQYRNRIAVERVSVKSTKAGSPASIHRPGQAALSVSAANRSAFKDCSVSTDCSISKDRSESSCRNASLCCGFGAANARGLSVGGQSRDGGRQKPESGNMGDFGSGTAVGHDRDRGKRTVAELSDGGAGDGDKVFFKERGAGKTGDSWAGKSGDAYLVCLYGKGRKQLRRISH